MKQTLMKEFRTENIIEILQIIKEKEIGLYFIQTKTLYVIAD